jgi:hypothetical protein
MRLALGAVLLAGLCGCGGDEPGTSGVTREESRQLNEAAAMLDAQSDTLIAADETGLANGEAAAVDVDAAANAQ